MTYTPKIYRHRESDVDACCGIIINVSATLRQSPARSLAPINRMGVWIGTAHWCLDRKF